MRRDSRIMAMGWVVLLAIGQGAATLRYLRGQIHGYLLTDRAPGRGMLLDDWPKLYNHPTSDVRALAACGKIQHTCISRPGSVMDIAGR